MKDMPLSLEEVRRIAQLARLRLSPEEEELFAQQLGEIVEYVDLLQGFATETAAPAGPALPEAEDTVAAGEVSPEQFLANAPDSLGTFLLVPLVKAAPSKNQE